MQNPGESRTPRTDLPADLRDYAEDLLSGTGIDLETILGLPHTASQTGPPELNGDSNGDLTSALWAGWSAAARHASPTGPRQLTLPDPSTEPSTAGTDGDDQ